MRWVDSERGQNRQIVGFEPAFEPRDFVVAEIVAPDDADTVPAEFLSQLAPARLLRRHQLFGHRMDLRELLAR